MSNRTRSWSIHGRPEITTRYEILGRVGSGSYADVYRGRRLSDSLIVALKEIHDQQSAIREIEALRSLHGAPNVIEMLEYFYDDDFEDDAVVVLEFLPSDLEAVISNVKKRGSAITPGEAKSWMLQVLSGVNACHQAGFMHRDLKPSNLLISAGGVLKVADFGQSRVLQDLGFEEATLNEANSEKDKASNQLTEADYLKELEFIREKSKFEDNASCLETSCTGDSKDVQLGSYTEEEPAGALTSCVGTRWYRAPELLYGSCSYGPEVDLWALGCIFAEMVSLVPLFRGVSDIDQIAKIITVLGDLNDENFSGCSNLPDFNKICYSKIENPTGLEACLPNRPIGEVTIVKRLLCYNPANRVPAIELLKDRYFIEGPLPVAIDQLTVPARDEADKISDGEWDEFRDVGSGPDDFDEFGSNLMGVTKTEKGFCISFS
ncbi:CDK-activating kinase 1AT [Carex rostrata]